MTKDDIERALSEAFNFGAEIERAGSTADVRRIGHEYDDLIKRTVALLTPEPEPTMLGMDPLESVSEYREDRLKITFTPSPHRPNELMVKLAGSWTGLTLVRLNVTDGAAWIVPQRPQLGPFRVRGEAVAAAIVTTFDPDNDQTPEPEPSDAEIEAGAKALHARLWHEGASRSQRGCTACRNDAKAVLLAARAARQTGGESNG